MYTFLTTLEASLSSINDTAFMPFLCCHLSVRSWNLAGSASFHPYIRERNGKKRFSTQHPLPAVVEIMANFAFLEDIFHFYHKKVYVPATIDNRFNRKKIYTTLLKYCIIMKDVFDENNGWIRNGFLVNWSPFLGFPIKRLYRFMIQWK